MMKLGEILLRKQWISAAELSQAVTQQRLTKKMLGEVLVEAGLIESQQLNMALKEQYWRNNGFWVISDENLPNHNFRLATV